MEFSSQGCWWVFLKIHIFLPARMADHLIVKLSAKHVFISRLRSTINANWGNNVNTITFASKGRLSVALNWKINRFHMISSNQRDTVWSSVVSKIAMFLYRKWVEENTNNLKKKIWVFYICPVFIYFGGYYCVIACLINILLNVAGEWVCWSEFTNLVKLAWEHNPMKEPMEVLRCTNNAHIKEHGRSQIISIITTQSTKQCKLESSN